MNRDRFVHHCLEAEAGRDTFVANSRSGEDGIVVSCSMETGHLVVRTPDNRPGCWDYRDCEDLPISGLMR